MTGAYAPAKTPAAVIVRLNTAMVRGPNKAEVKERFFNAGIDVVGSSPEQLAVQMKSDIARWGKIIKEAGIRAD